MPDLILPPTSRSPRSLLPIVLVIDDAPEIHRLLASRLGTERLSLRSAMTAGEGVALARQLQPEVILLDIELPDRNGFSVCRELKADPLTQTIPILFLTASSGVGDKVHGLDLGAMDYITKPFDAAELRARVRSALRIKRYQDLLAQRAQIDPLTGLSARSFFERRLREEMAAHNRHSHPLAVALAEVDRFKQLTEERGHPFSDVVLQSISEVLVAEVREPDIVCRYGDALFAVLLRDTNTAGAGVVARRALDKLPALPLPPAGRGVAVTLSIGVTGTDVLGSEHGSAAVLLATVERALYQAQRAGGARITLSEAVSRPEEPDAVRGERSRGERPRGERSRGDL